MSSKIKIIFLVNGKIWLENKKGDFKSRPCKRFDGFLQNKLTQIPVFYNFIQFFFDEC
jgi:hypothetical protein